jgi:hypothetical protein
MAGKLVAQELGYVEDVEDRTGIKALLKTLSDRQDLSADSREREANQQLFNLFNVNHRNEKHGAIFCALALVAVPVLMSLSGCSRSSKRQEGPSGRPTADAGDAGALDRGLATHLRLLEGAASLFR